MIDEKRLLKLIPKGKKNRISSTELERLADCDKRSLKGAISRLRRNGVLICSSVYSGGYYLPASSEELEEWVRTEQARIRTHRAAIKPAVDFLKRYIRR